MRAKLWQTLEALKDSFWLIPALIVASGVVLAEGAISLDRRGVVADSAVSAWLYEGGEAGARTLLGAIAGSTIAVAATVFSITIATLTLASNQMGPRLLRNFVRDRGNQATLGIYLATFEYSLLVLRSVRGMDENAFVPHFAITGGVCLALVCVAMLIFFVNHIASKINAETVIDLVYQDLRRALLVLTTQEAPPGDECEAQLRTKWDGTQPICNSRGGFIQQLDDVAIADWAQANGVSIRLFARVGSFVFPGGPIALVRPGNPQAVDVLQSAMALGATPTSSMDLEFTVTQLTDIAVRALSPGINDPNTAIRVTDRLGAALCVLSERHLPTGTFMRDGRIVFERDCTDYAGLTDAMFHPVRQNAGHSAAVFIHLVEVLIAVARCERCPLRRASIRRHAELVREDGMRAIPNEADRNDLATRLATLFEIMGGPPPGTASCALKR
jgi:uncharacterized membrane protein